MKTVSVRFCLFAVLLAAGPTAFAQYPAHFGGGPVGMYPAGYANLPQPGPVFMQPGPGAMPPGAMPPGVMIPPQPFVGSNVRPVQSAVPFSAMQQHYGDVQQAYRVTVVNEQPNLAGDVAQCSATADCDGKGCNGKGCDCKGGCKGDCCCDKRCHRLRVYGDYLYLRARDAEVPYAVQINSNVQVPAIQTSPIGMLDPGVDSGFRMGFGVALDDCSEIGAAFTLFESRTTDSIDADQSGPLPTAVIRSLVVHPSTLVADVDTLEAGAQLDLNFDLIDLDYRRTIASDCYSQTQVLVGIRYAKLEQKFGSRFSDDLSQPFGEILVGTDIDFTGTGLRAGLEWERCGARLPVLVYAKGYTSLLAGEFNATYQQSGDLVSVADVDTEWEAGRIVPTFDLEVGMGIDLPCWHLRATVGYVYSAWTNVLTADEWINSVQANNFTNLGGDTLTFDGLVGRAELRF